MKPIKIIISLFILVFVIGITGYLWITANAGPSLNTAENALADEHLIAFAHLDNKKINQIVNSIGPDLKPDLLEDKSRLLKALYFEAPNFKDNVYQAMYGLTYNAAESKAKHSLLLHGSFSWQVLESALTNHFTITPLGNNKFQLQANVTVPEDSFVCPDEKSAKPPIVFYVHASPDWLIFSDNLEQVDTLLKRMANKEQAEIDLTPWREYRRGKLASFALYNPEYVGQSLGGMSGYVAGNVYKKNTDIRAAFSSIDLSFLNPGLHLNGHVIANKTWATKQALASKKQMAETRLSATEYSPVLANLLDTLQVSNNEDTLDVDFIVTQNDIEKIPEAMSEILSSLFNFGSGSSDSKEELTAESVNENPWDFANNQKLASLPAFKAGTFSGVPSLINGPFAITMEKVSIGKESGLVELDLKGLMSIEKIDGFWNNSKANLSLSIDSVTSVSQQELLKDERCDKQLPRFTTKNQQAVNGFNTDSDHAYVSKTIRLIPNAKFSEIDAINGKLSVLAPVDVNIVNINFQQGKSFKNGALEFTITKAQQQSVTYKVKGKTENILEVRALNDKGQVLNFSHSFGNDDSKKASYRGDIAKLQLVIANQWLDKKINFTVKHEDFLKGKPAQQYKINQLPSRASKKDVAAFSKVNLVEITPEKIKKVTYSADKFVGSADISPVKLLVSHDYQSSWSFQPKLRIAMPLIDALAFNLQAVSVEIDQEVQFTTFVNANVGYRVNDGKSIGKYKGNMTLGKAEYMFNKVDLELPLESGQKLSTLKGNLSYHLPKKVQFTDIDVPALGQVINVGGVELTLITIKAGFMAGYTFEVSGDELINIVAITDQGSFYPTQNRFKDGKWQLDYSLFPKIRTLRVLLATEKEAIIKPFEIELDYATADQ